MWMRRAPLGRALRSLGLAVGAGVAMSLTAAPSPAAVMRYYYGGTITAADPSSGAAVGTPFSGTFAYDPTGPRDNSEPKAYSPEAPIYQFARSTSGADLYASVGGTSTFGPADKLSITVQGPHSYLGGLSDPQGVIIEGGVDSTSGPNVLELSFLNTEHPLPFGYGLPTNFHLDDFTASTFSVTGLNGKVLFQGTITNLGPTPLPEPTPEPTTLAILATAGGLLFARSRARHGKGLNSAAELRPQAGRGVRDAARQNLVHHAA